MKEGRRRSKTRIFLHLVWATRKREAFLSDPKIERRIHRCIQSKAQELGCVVLAINGMADHVHLVLQIPPTLAAANLVKAVKGASSTLARRELEEISYFSWQEGYGAFSVSQSHLKRVIAYVEHQKQRHAEGKLWPELEDVDEAAE